MKLFEYEEKAMATAEYPSIGENILYPVLGLVGEAGEVAEAVKKMCRTNEYQSTILGQAIIETDKYGKSVIYTNSKKEMVKKELGDVLWYLAACAREIGSSLEEVAETNLQKLAERRLLGTISVTEKRGEEQ